MKTSLLISTYNWPEALDLCLGSLLRQCVLPDEILVADDGSGPETGEVVHRYEKLFPIPVRHIWHEDDGFRLAMIRNKAIAASRYEYVIQIDGDTLCGRNFVKDHIRLAEPGHFVSGSRVMLGERITRRLLAGSRIRLHPFRRDLDYRANSLRFLPLAPLFRGYKPDQTRGCNMAFWRDDLVRVNGYDETFTGWGGEDSDIALRLTNCGITKHALKLAGVQYHLYHPINSRENEERNWQLYYASRDSGRTRCEKGLDQYLQERLRRTEP